MLFRKKDSSEGQKAKTSFFARRATKKAAEVKEDIPETLAQSAADKATETKSFKQTVAKGSVNPNILKNPRITEKGTDLSVHNVYVFDVAVRANKKLVAAAIKDVYGITPKSVRMVNISAKTKTSRRGVRSRIGGGKKAYVQLQSGDTIELV